MNARREPPAPRISLAELFDRALDVAPAERAAFVREACRADPAREAEVLALLASDASATGPLDSPLGAALEPLLASGAGQAPAPDAPPTVPPGSRIGPYAIIEVLGRGGMGTVYLAERADGAYSQRVALKLVSAGTHSADLERRFLRERQILARLDHPGIARLLDGGLTADGRPYLVMQLVEGTPITQWADTHALGIDDRLALLLRVCDAVQYAHRQLIVHRDLKPANILVTAGDDVRLLDFGIATLLSPDDAQEQVTRTGMLLLTPEYAAPEQLRGEPVTTASDVYALGVLLHELLTGRRPHAGSARSLSDFVHLAEQEPPPPSRSPGLDPGRRRRIAGDLDAIVQTALRREPERRYSSVEALADDVRAHLEHLPIGARPDTARYRVSRFVRRHTAGVAAALALALTLVAGLIGTTRMAAVANAERTRSEAVRAFLFSLWQGADPEVNRGTIPTALDLLERGVGLIDSISADAGADVRTDLLSTLGFLYVKLGRYDQAAEIFRRAVVEADSAFGADERTGGALDGLAQSLEHAGRSIEAESVARRSVEVRRAAGSADSALASSYSVLGAALMNQSRLEEAKAAHLMALELDRRSLGHRNVAVATDLNNLGRTAHALGDFVEAERHLRESVRLRRELSGPLSTALAVSLGNLAATRREAGDYVEAESLQREALAIRQQVLGPDHPDIAISLDALGRTVQIAGRDDEADSLLVLALALRRHTLGDRHPETVATMNNLATVRFLRGAYREAAQVQRDVVAAALAADPTLSTADAITQVHNLGVMLSRTGNLAEAEQHLQRALVARRRVLGPDHIAVGVSLRWLSELRRLQQRPAEAESLAREARRTLSTSYAPDHPRIAEATLCLGAALVEQRRISEAVPLLREALDIRRATLPLDGIPVAEARVWLGTALLRGGEAGAGRAQLDSALVTYRVAGRLNEIEARAATRALGRS